ncbi:exodeoxyribonuclease VII large subunit [Pelagovum pacificum]|uniref:Exodeoxyribonuclease 7 large subunit n=2 Tax=Pelagovum pacificum TaxID=2588711 RepID=A0A5C5GI20_9RHOB|nr:exodeoxyribonuclease VII large subunit [Pelagovum pacificum]QQA44900.1 exodeoxyribonuclease VII large subunit [Pelagovum pacificum]TNY34343.1 exodeoxyribonuclease VII large subunit [Pelagovum pacificum]
MDLFEDGTGNAPEFTVSEISGAVKKTLEDSFGRIRVRGEVGRVFKARSGHLYYDIKDDRNVLACTTWKGQIASLSVTPEEGMEVIVTGRLTSFGAQSKYNLNVDEVSVAGVGALMAMFEKRKKALEAEGLFAAERKRPVPYLPEVIGVVTSPSGAVIRDILHRLRERFPRKVLVWPVAVQGKACAPEVARAIEGFNAMTPGGALPRPDLLIVARGGGSIEDLWGFNEEIVARAAAASDIPLISAVGHETDTTLIDFVSDRRAPTPTAAAEMAVPVRLELMALNDQQGARLTRALGQGVMSRRQRLTDLARGLGRPESLTEGARQRLDSFDTRLPVALRALASRKEAALSSVAGALRPGALRRLIGQNRRTADALAGRLGPALGRVAATRRERFDGVAGRLRPDRLSRGVVDQRRSFDALSLRLSRAAVTDHAARRDRLAAMDRLRETLGYKQTLARGYAVVWGDDGVVTTVAGAQAASKLEIQFADGRMEAGSGVAATTAPKPARKKGDDGPEGQGELF